MGMWWMLGGFQSRGLSLWNQTPSASEDGQAASTAAEVVSTCASVVCDCSCGQWVLCLFSLLVQSGFS